jgi:hypothetical protein
MAQEIIFSIAPLVKFTDYNYSFREFLKYGIKKVNVNTVYPELNFDGSLNPGFQVKIEYQNLSLLTGMAFENFLDISTIDPQAVVYNAQHKPIKYYFNRVDGGPDTSTNVNMQVDYFVFKQMWFELEYHWQPHISFFAVFNTNDLDIGKDMHWELRSEYKGEGKGTLSDTTLGYIDHHLLINNFSLGLNYNFTCENYSLTTTVEVSPLSFWQIGYDDNFLNKVYKEYSGFSIGGGAQFKYKWLYLKYAYQFSTAGEADYHLNSHILEAGFFWQALKFDTKNIDIFY